jgi:alpha-tubulin suppressor-like RCC1 family protein
MRVRAWTAIVVTGWCACTAPKPDDRPVDGSLGTGGMGARADSGAGGISGGRAGGASGSGTGGKGGSGATGVGGDASSGTGGTSGNPGTDAGSGGSTGGETGATGGAGSGGVAGSETGGTSGADGSVAGSSGSGSGTAGSGGTQDGGSGASEGSSGGGTGGLAGEGGVPDASDGGCPAECSAPRPVCSTGACRGIRQVSVGGYHACAVLDDGTVRCWGDNTMRTLGDGTDAPYYPFPARAVLGVREAVQVSACHEHSCAVTRSGSVWCWGDNYYGQLGVDGRGRLPAQVQGLDDQAVEVGCHGDSDFSSGFTCARMSSGKVYCWGANFNGQLGNGSLTSSPTPTPVTGLTDAVQIAFGPASACAIRSGGSVVCWGDNRAEVPLGTASTEPELKTPEPVLGLSDVHEIAGGLFYYCAIAGDERTVKCWGWNDWGQIGPPVGGILIPPFDTNVKPAEELSGGWRSSCARRGGDVYCWGNNWRGQLGNGTNLDSPVITTPVSLAAPAKSFHFSWAAACALLETGRVQCWGENYYGLIGDGSVGVETSTNVPKFVDWSHVE